MKWNLLFFLLLLINSCATTQNSTSLSTPASQETAQTSGSEQEKTELDILVEEHFLAFIEQEQNVGLSIALIDGDDTQYFHYGEVQKGSGERPTNDHLWEIGSITKTYTAAMVKAYCAEQSIGLDTPVNNFLPEDFNPLSKDGQVMTLLHLLNHTAGLPRLPEDHFDGADQMDPYIHYGKEKIMAYLNKFEPSRVPGEIHEYSNLGFAVLGLLMETHSGRSYHELLSEYVLAPLQMENSFLSLNEEQTALQVHPYFADGADGIHWNMAAWAPTGALQTNIVDLADYARAQLPAYEGPLASIFKDAKTITFEENANMSIGQAWITISSPEFNWYFHNGGTYGFSSLLLADPETGKAIVLLSNNAFQQETEPLGFKLFKAYTQL